MIGLVLVVSIFTMSNDQKMIVVVIIIDLFIVVTISPLDGLHKLHGFLHPVVRLPIDGAKRGVYREGQGLLVCGDLQRFSLVLQRLAVSLVEGDVSLVVIMLHGQVVVVIIVQIREGF